MKKSNKKKLILPVLLLLLLVGIGTTVAWLTSTSELTNNFTVGSFNVPTTDPEDETEELDTTNGSLNGNLYEKSWNVKDEHKLTPGVSFNKDPYVGIGPDSEDAVVYLYVENNFSNAENNYSNKVYFAINDGWEAVENETTSGPENGTYTSGLFKYSNVLESDDEKDSWTTEPLFSRVVVADDANTEDFTPAQGKNSTITVKSFLHQANDASGNAIDNNTVILPAVKTAFGL